MNFRASTPLYQCTAIASTLGWAFRNAGNQAPVTGLPAIAGETVCRACAVTRDQWATASSTVMLACFGWSGSLKPSTNSCAAAGGVRRAEKIIGTNVAGVLSFVSLPQL